MEKHKHKISSRRQEDSDDQISPFDNSFDQTHKVNRNMFKPIPKPDLKHRDPPEEEQKHPAIKSSRKSDITLSNINMSLRTSTVLAKPNINKTNKDDPKPLSRASSLSVFEH